MAERGTDMETEDRIVHRGLHHKRTAGDFTQAVRERAFADLWEQENSGTMSTGTLDLLLLIKCEPTDKGAINSLMTPFLYHRHAIPYCGASAVVAATVVQWLGTNVGWCFLNRAVEAAGYKIVKQEEGEHAD